MKVQPSGQFEGWIWETQSKTDRFADYKALWTKQGAKWTCLYEPACQIVKFAALENIDEETQSGGRIPQSARAHIDEYLLNEGLERDDDAEADEEMAREQDERKAPKLRKLASAKHAAGEGAGVGSDTESDSISSDFAPPAAAAPKAGRKKKNKRKRA